MVDGYQKLIDSYQKLENDYQKLEDGYQKLENDYQKLENDYQKLVDGWKITLSFKLSSSPYHIHLQPVTLFLEDMADFFTHSVFISARVISGICSELTTFAVESPTIRVTHNSII